MAHVRAGDRRGSGHLREQGSPTRHRSRAAVTAVAVALLLGLLGGVGPARAADPPRSALVSGWLPSWATPTALAGVEGNADLFADVSPFWFTARATGGTTTVTSSVDDATRAAVLASLRARGLAVLPSVADGSAARAMATVLKDPAARAAHVAQLVGLVAANGYDGIELDYEKFAFSDGSSTWATTRPAWVAFVTELGTALHAAGKKLALAVPPMYDGSRSASSGYWVYDYAGIASVVDSLRIMTYDYSVSRPGPISPPSFLRRTLSYAVTAFPAARIRMGLPAYGRLWTARRADGTPAITGTCPTGAVPGTTSFTTAQAATYLASVAGAAPAVRYDEATAETVATFSKQYVGAAPDGSPTSCVVDHVAWWVDARGVAARLPLVAEFGVAGVAVWHLGGVDADSWSAMRGFALASAPAPASLTVTAPARHVAGSPITVSAVVGSPAPVPAGTPITLERRSKGSTRWRPVGQAPTDAVGLATFTLPGPTTTTTWRARVPAAPDRVAAVGRAVTTVAPRVEVRVSTLTPKRGSKVTMKVRLTPKKKGVKVVRQMLVKGRWKTMASKRTTAKGRVTFTVRWPRARTENTYRVLTRASGGLVAGSSEQLVITTR